jgi:hypothetical protein
MEGCRGGDSNPAAARVGAETEELEECGAVRQSWPFANVPSAEAVLVGPVRLEIMDRIMN